MNHRIRAAVTRACMLVTGYNASHRDARRGAELLPLASLVCGSLLGGAAFAQSPATLSSTAVSSSADDSLAEVIVTARKQTETVQSIPESITVIDANAMEHAHLTTLDNFSSMVTNLNITQRADNTPDVVMRGVGAYGIVQGVGFYVNDIQQFDGQSVRPDDIERVEVLKGPQGTIFGGSNIGGAIKYVTKLPTNTPTAEATLEYGEYNDRIIDAVVSGPVVADRLLARLSVFHEQSDGFLPDPTLHRTLPQSNETGGRLTLEYPGDETKVLFYLSGDHINSQNMNLYYTPPDDHTYENVYNGGVDGSVPLFKRDLYSPTLEITHDFGDVTLSSNTSYFHSSITSLGNLDKGATAPRFANYLQDFRKNVVSEELRLTSNGNTPLKWLLGAFAQQIHTDSLQLQDFGTAAVIGSPVGETPNLFATSSIQDRHFNRDYAVFGNLSYTLNNWTFEGGLRVAHFVNTMTDVPYFNAFSQTGSSCGPCSGTVSETDVLPKVSADYHFTKDVMGYVTIARGDEESDLTENTDAAGVNEVLPYKTEFALSYEAGVKTTLFDRHLTLNAAGFYVDYKNRLFEITQFTPSGYFTFTDNIGSSKNYGFELEAIVRPTSELTLTSGVGVTRAVFGNAIFNDGYGNPVNANGNQAAYTPEYQATLALDWRHNLTDQLVLDPSINARFIGRSYWDSAGCSGNVTLAAVTNLNSPPYNVPPAFLPTPPYLACPADGFRVEQRPYQIVDAGVSLDIGTHWRVGAHVQNLFDTRYNTWYSAASESGAPYNIAQINRPRQWFVSFTARY